MAVVVVNCPVKMMSLSAAAVAKVSGIEHQIERLLGLSVDHPTNKNGGRNLTDGFNVWTMCGQQIDAYPETEQGVVDCQLCAHSRKPPSALILYRIMPPAPVGPGLGWRWSNSYWSHHHDNSWVAHLTPLSSGEDPTPRAETAPAMRLA
jgi:hypothetical protein